MNDPSVALLLWAWKTVLCDHASVGPDDDRVVAATKSHLMKLGLIDAFGYITSKGLDLLAQL